MRSFETRIVTALVLLLLGFAAAACGGGVEQTTEQSSPSVTSSQQPAPTPSTTPSTPAGDPSHAAGGSVDGIPYYQPATVVSQSTGSTVLGTRDPIRKVAAFYSDVVDTEGWTVVSKAVTQNGASFTIKKSGKGASIAIGRGIAGWPTAISISTYTSW